MSENITQEDRPRLFFARTIVRDCTRTAYVECDCDFDHSQNLARQYAIDRLGPALRQKYGSVIGSLILAIALKLLTEWIIEMLRRWIAIDVKSPALHWQQFEPGYETVWEDDES